VAPTGGCSSPGRPFALFYAPSPRSFPLPRIRPFCHELSLLLFFHRALCKGRLVMASLDNRRSEVAQLPMRTGAIPHLHVWTECLCTSISQTARKEKRNIKIEKIHLLNSYFSVLFSQLINLDTNTV